MSQHTALSETRPRTQAAEHLGRPATRMVLAVLRILFGITFLWAFVDKLLGLGKATSSENAWANGGDPITGGLLHLLRWLSAFPLENSSFVDDHLTGAVTLVLFALAGAGDTFGLGSWWKSTGAVQRMPILH